MQNPAGMNSLNFSHFFECWIVFCAFNMSNTYLHFYEKHKTLALLRGSKTQSLKCQTTLVNIYALLCVIFTFEDEGHLRKAPGSIAKVEWQENTSE